MTQSGELPLAIGITFTISGKQSDEKVQVPASENFVDQQEFFDSYQEDSFWDDSYYGDDPSLMKIGQIIRLTDVPPPSLMKRSLTKFDNIREGCH